MAAPLVDVHVGLPPPPLPHAAVVRRPFAHHHYLGPPDHFDDRGWGCAYRSCQTLLSSLLGAAAPVPTVMGLQEALVAMNDKPAHFVGSREWIGSTEVGLLVERLSGHEYRIATLEPTESIASKVQLFAEHFRAVGAPIMAGGRGTAAAQTILGVAWGPSEAEPPWFLVLDPHYTGADELAAVQGSAQGCQWHPLAYWGRGASRYFCLPSATKVDPELAAAAQQYAEAGEAGATEWVLETVASGCDGQ